MVIEMNSEILKDIQQFDTIVIHRHKNPDGDAIGSQVGLAEIIRENFPGKKVYTVGDEAGRYSFMDGSVMDEVDDEVYGEALAIVLDTSATALISDERYTKARKTARIDHHLFCEKICEDEWTDSSFESCCGMIAFFAKENGLKTGNVAAKSLYTGMVTDSGRFRYDATTSRTFELAAFLMQEEFDITGIYMNLYAEDYDQAKVRARFLLKSRLTEHHVAYIYNTLQEVEESGLSTFAVSRGMVGVMADMKGIDIWVNFTEAPEGVFCEIRSGKYNINPIAVKYGGGGHAKASGATVPDRETAMRMLDDLDEMCM